MGLSKKQIYQTGAEVADVGRKWEKANSCGN